jgi:hypothetical protein
MRSRNSVQDYSYLFKDNDIAILKLDKELNFNKHVQAACLPDPYLGENEALDALVTGWGGTEYGTY